MRLLNTSTLKLEEFFSRPIPPYVILSHTWGNEEVTYQDMQSMQTSELEKKDGYSKLRGSCGQAAKDGFTYIWIDTCCIDKTSSAELSEAINSMYRWYKNAHICYAYLVDVSNKQVGLDSAEHHLLHVLDQFEKARYFARGWTLQELIAPEVVEFYDVEWTEIGTKSSLADPLAKITGIDIRVLNGADPSICNAAERLSWASSRTTTRVEDAAYCMLGLFNIFLPLLYGEGQRAFRRLQEEILKTTEDYTLLAWDINQVHVDHQIFSASRIWEEGEAIDHYFNRRNALAQQISDFKIAPRREPECKYSDLVLDVEQSDIFSRSDVEESYNLETMNVHSPTVMNDWLRISLPVSVIRNSVHIAYLYCKYRQTNELLCMALTPIELNHQGNRYKRRAVAGSWYLFVSKNESNNLGFPGTSFRLATIWIDLYHDSGLSSLQTPGKILLGDLGIRITIDMTGFWGGYSINPNWNETQVTENPLDPISGSHIGHIKSSRYHEWKVRVHANHLVQLLFEARILLLDAHPDYEDNFAVQFGLRTERLWCAIVHLVDASLSPERDIERWDGNHLPKVLVDRATETLRCAEVSVKTRMSPDGVDVKIVIKQQAVRN